MRGIVFSNCLLPKEVAIIINSQIDEIEMEVLHASWPSEFSHSLDPIQTWAANLCCDAQHSPSCK